MSKAVCRVVESTAFHTTVIVVIVLNAILMGVETSQAMMASHGGLLRGLNLAIQAAFVVEIALRLAAHWPRVQRFFTDGWNVFDFSVVALSFLPTAGPFATVARLARVLRIGRLVSVSNQLRLIISTMLRSLPSLAHVVILLSVLLYVYAIIGNSLFRAEDPQHWGSLAAALLSAFQLLTLEGWVEMQSAVLAKHPFSWIFFGSFIVVAVFVVVNLFIAVVLNNLEEVKAEQIQEQAPSETAPLLAQIAALRAQLDQLEASLRKEKDEG